MESKAIRSDPDILGGTPVFVGTRVPVQNLFDYLEAGDSLDQFLTQFPSVRREQAVAALKLARKAVLSGGTPVTAAAGYGNYTEERRELFGDLTLDQALTEMKSAAGFKGA